MMQRTIYSGETHLLKVRHVSAVPEAGPEIRSASDPSLTRLSPDEGVRLGSWYFWPNMHGRSYPVSSQTLARWKAVASGLDTQVAPGTALTGDGLSTTSREMKRTTLEDLLRSPLGIGLSKTRNIHFEYSKAFIDPITTVVVVLHSPFLVVLAVALPAVYGGVHLSAWNFDFPTPMEHLLWKSACLIIIGAVPAVVGAAAITFFHLTSILPRYGDRVRRACRYPYE
jgi:hypothetical protein